MSIQQSSAQSPSPRSFPPAVLELLAAERPDGWFEFASGTKARCPGTRRISAAVPNGRCADPFFDVLDGTVVRVRIDVRTAHRVGQRVSGGRRICSLCHTPLVVVMDDA